MNKEIYIDEDKLIQLSTPKYAARIIIGGTLTVNVLREFNWFQKKMIKFFFGWDVEDIDE